MNYHVLAEPHLSQRLTAKEQFPAVFMTSHLFVVKSKSLHMHQTVKTPPLIVLSLSYSRVWVVAISMPRNFQHLSFYFFNVIGVHLLQNLQV